VARGDALDDADVRDTERAEARALRARPVAITRDAELLRLHVRYIQSLDPPERLRSPAVVARILDLVGDDETQQTAVSRPELLALLAR
jgi:hypothetical protein